MATRESILSRGQAEKPEQAGPEAPKQESGPGLSSEAVETIERLKAGMKESEKFASGLGRVAIEDILANDPEALDEIYTKEIGQGKLGKDDAPVFKSAGSGLKLWNKWVWFWLKKGKSDYVLEGEKGLVDATKLDESVEQQLDQNKKAGFKLTNEERAEAVRLGGKEKLFGNRDYAIRYEKVGGRVEKKYYGDRSESEAIEKAGEILEEKLKNLATMDGIDLIQEKDSLEKLRNQTDALRENLKKPEIDKLEKEMMLKQRLIDEKETALKIKLETFTGPLKKNQEGIEIALKSSAEVLTVVTAQEATYKEEIKALQQKIRLVGGASEVIKVLGEEAVEWKAEEASKRADLQGLTNERVRLDARIKELNRRKNEVERARARIDKIGKTSDELKAGKAKTGEAGKDQVPAGTFMGAAPGAVQTKAAQTSVQGASSEQFEYDSLEHPEQYERQSEKELDENLVPSGERGASQNKTGKEQAGFEVPIKSGKITGTARKIGVEAEQARPAGMNKNKARIKLNNEDIARLRVSQGVKAETSNEAATFKAEDFENTHMLNGLLHQNDLLRDKIQSEASTGNMESVEACAGEMNQNFIQIKDSYQKKVSGGFKSQVEVNNIIETIDFNNKRIIGEAINKAQEVRVNAGKDEEAAAYSDDDYDKEVAKLDQKRVALDQGQASPETRKNTRGAWFGAIKRFFRFKPEGGRRAPKNQAENAPAVESSETEPEPATEQRAEREEIKLQAGRWLEVIFPNGLWGSALKIAKQQFKLEGKGYFKTAVLNLDKAKTAYVGYLMESKRLGYDQAVEATDNKFNKLAKNIDEAWRQYKQTGKVSVSENGLSRQEAAASADTQAPAKDLEEVLNQNLPVVPADKISTAGERSGRAGGGSIKGSGPKPVDDTGDKVIKNARRQGSTRKGGSVIRPTSQQLIQGLDDTVTTPGPENKLDQISTQESPADPGKGPEVQTVSTNKEEKVESTKDSEIIEGLVAAKLVAELSEVITKNNRKMTQAIKKYFKDKNGISLTKDQAIDSIAGVLKDGGEITGDAVMVQAKIIVDRAIESLQKDISSDMSSKPTPGVESVESQQEKITFSSAAWLNEFALPNSSFRQRKALEKFFGKEDKRADKEMTNVEAIESYVGYYRIVGGKTEEQARSEAEEIIKRIIS